MSTTKVSAETIAAAEILAGVQYSAAERAIMADNLAGQIALAKARRGVSLPVDLPPATLFDPRLPGWKAPLATGFHPVEQTAPPLPSDEADLAFAPLSTLGAWFRSGALSSLRLTEIYLRRIAQYGSRLQCIATVTADHAREQARRADALLARGTWLGPLHGMPWGCKDIIDTAGIVTGWGAEPWRDRVPQSDAVVVQRLNDAGAVMVAKTAVGALAYGDIWYGGVSRNPWNLDEGSSGSSAGSASGVAAGLFAFALGTETLGSIVAPSERCGTIGLRPTFGRVARTGVMPLSWTLDKVGAIARTVEDAALVLAAIDGDDPGDLCSIAAPLNYDAARSLDGLRLGYYAADFPPGAEGAIDQRVLEAARELGMTLVPLEREALPYDALMNVVFAEAAASFESLTLDGRDDQLTWQDAGAWPNAFRKARFLSAVDHIQLDRLRRLVMMQMDAVFGRVDCIIGPSMGPMLIITNFTGHPCLTLRSGFLELETRGALSLANARIATEKSRAGALHSVPHSISLWGRLFDEGTLLAVGRGLERKLDVWDRRPALAPE
ncbi:MAG TPA: amidase [Bauldia sp.]|nr:amidase [Bauldia sp.]